MWPAQPKAWPQKRLTIGKSMACATAACVVAEEMLIHTHCGIQSLIVQQLLLQLPAKLQIPPRAPPYIICDACLLRTNPV